METATALAFKQQAQPHQPQAGFHKEAGGFTPLHEQHSGKVRPIAPSSHEWKMFDMDSRIGSMPILGSMIACRKAEVVFCEIATSTCDEKAKAAGIHSDHIVKAILFKEVFGSERYLIVATGKGKLKTSGLLSAHAIDAQIEPSHELPSCMKHGTCTPFIPLQVLEGIEFIAVESPDIQRKGKKGRTIGRIGDIEVDVAIGGTDQLSHHLSVRMRYEDLVIALQEAYGEKVKILSEIERV
jgi:hypothetical protein